MTGGFVLDLSMKEVPFVKKSISHLSMNHQKTSHGSFQPLLTLVISALLVAFLPTVGSSAPLTPAPAGIVTDTDWTSAGVSGIGSPTFGGGDATITLSGVSGAVTRAFLYWQGINNSGTSAVYDAAGITFNGVSITGTSIGDTHTNFWGNGSSRAFRAVVTSLVTGNGAYMLNNLANCPGCDANGASLVVMFDDGNASNNRDLYILQGNDANLVNGFPGETDGWYLTFAGFDYSGGDVRAQLHVADGQILSGSGLDDGSLSFQTVSGTVSGTAIIPDAGNIYDGNSLPSAGHSRAPNGNLWDIHTFDISSAFGPAGIYTVLMDGMYPSNDALGLIALLVDTPSVKQPPDSQPVPEPSTVLLLGGGVTWLLVYRRRNP
jgi:hypothetical protein